MTSEKFKKDCCLVFIQFPSVLEEIEQAFTVNNYMKIRLILEDFMDSINFKVKLDRYTLHIHNDKVDMYNEVQALYNDFMEELILATLPPRHREFSP